MRQTRDATLTIRLTSAGKKRLEAEVARAGDDLTVSELVREVLDATLLTSDARGEPLREVARNLRTQHRPQVVFGGDGE